MEKDSSIFTDKTKAPGSADLAAALGQNYQLWQEVCDLVYAKYPAAQNEWKWPGAKHGWSFRIKDRKRVIIYLLPRDKSFMVAFVFGPKAYEEVLASNVSAEIKEDLRSATAYVEGRGVRIEVKDRKTLKDIEQLVDIKLAY